MSQSNGLLTGKGAAYIRVSTDLQDTERQYTAIRSFEDRNGVKIPKHNWFKDEGWARDKADTRPDFQRLMKLAESGQVQWIVVDQLDRFGTKNAKQLIAYLHRLDEAGCKLYDATGREWTAEDIATIITAVVEGEKSKGEQTSKSHRVLGGKIEKARAGEWQGGPVRLGFDVVCFHRETDKELWRVVYESREKRLKLYVDGRTERFDGARNFPKSQPMTEVLRVAPSTDKAKINAAVSVFQRFATESISFTALAHYLNGLGFRNSYGGMFQGPHIESMLEDPIYLGYYSWNKRHFGKFHRYTNGQTVVELNYEETGSKNDKADWVQSQRLFKPLVDRKIWDAVQKKLDKPKRNRSPRSAALYLSGLVYCGNCGGRMVAGPVRKPKSKARKDGSTGERYEYICGTYFKAVREGRRQECACLRNGVFQDTLDAYIGRYLEESGRRLELLSEGLDSGHLTDKLDEQETEHWQAFRDGIKRLTAYLAEHYADEYSSILREFHAADTSPDDFVEACVRCYRTVFDPSVVEAELAGLRGEHERLVQRWADLPTKRSKDTAAARLAALDARMEELEQQRGDSAEVVARHYGEMHDLQVAIADAKLAMKSDSGDRELRRRAELIRSVIQRIECTFEATGITGAGWGKKNSDLTKITIYPISDDFAEFSADSKGTLLYSSAHSCM